jgi:hypothetical protein
MQILTYSAFIFLVVTLCLGAPTKPSNGCGYAVSEFEDIFSSHFDSNVDFRHAI